ncbi:MAG: tRNA (uridine(34)/cytosine(34)/5-carboxymethylaminomethyluridine(34)-2'-O)-methyltransferase TrmL [Piscirickettsiaceae bacterium CG_4_9_14_3_um_filter_43_564]|nr:tRNA (cytidine(34)-2'-O)-methyltransferase [Thiomicrospira sp.]OIP95737.1 MAG: tRNA (uridine(34)/cytosine(34)/5-carboxymethylaminomethyluridine(34)-2'-O)-methyltransferase TrmL [Thiomicrospira sp. CG2_30_44_34]PIQ06062.1 MAG: tRNA (uridine(34)/cytosine(34)/5-carboxymethylaminomethyluridine(34)-2'-O)-methyltransferase TrmL [Piscirickettsiaceae bacterium CG18_big_fil_WC_8_21_14_2_50_44_103]PIU38135.1 MAG: tRNA (uridine(34)/cytosine(34)/5-carboxymethylaminomethyluridine(34)-2'-O)-methyltransfera
MIHIILYEPEIPQNTGALIRLSANMGAHLHLIQPYAFDLSEKKVRRAGLDYAELANLHEHESLDACLAKIQPNRVFALTTKTTRYYTEPNFADGDAFLFGPETRGLPASVIESLPEAQRLTIPMRPNVRSLNMANAVSVVAYEAWRQLEFNMTL